MAISLVVVISIWVFLNVNSVINDRWLGHEGSLLLSLQGYQHLGRHIEPEIYLTPLELALARCIAYFRSAAESVSQASICLLHVPPICTRHWRPVPNETRHAMLHHG